MRRRPYTAAGIKRVPCVKCGRPSHHQWNACSVPGQWFAVCVECDIGLNRVALEYLNFPNRADILRDYEITARAAL
jgi:hypothetical protein